MPSHASKLGQVASPSKGTGAIKNNFCIKLTSLTQFKEMGPPKE